MKNIVSNLSVEKCMEIIDYSLVRLAESRKGIIVTFPTNFSPLSIFLFKNGVVKVNNKLYSSMDKDAIYNYLSSQSFIGTYETIDGHIDIK